MGSFNLKLTKPWVPYDHVCLGCCPQYHFRYELDFEENQVHSISEDNVDIIR